MAGRASARAAQHDGGRLKPAAPHAYGRLGLRAVAIFEAAKGLIGLLVGSGLLLLQHRDVPAAARRVLVHLHLNPASRYARLVLRLAAGATPGHLRLLALGALVYAVLRCTEGVGLWAGRRWAAWLGASTGLVYVPFEVAAIVRVPGPEPILALVINLAIVLFLGIQLWLGSKTQESALTP